MRSRDRMSMNISAATFRNANPKADSQQSIHDLVIRDHETHSQSEPSTFKL